jgi:hypothetical protein
VSDCRGCRNTRVLSYLIEILSDHKFLPDVTGCRKTPVSDCTSSTVPVLLHNAVLLLPLDRKKQTVAFNKINHIDKMSVQSNKKIINL